MNFRLSIASAHAFLLVYSITDASSFATVKDRFEEIREQRADFQVRKLKIYKMPRFYYWFIYLEYIDSLIEIFQYTFDYELFVGIDCLYHENIDRMKMHFLRKMSGKYILL